MPAIPERTFTTGSRLDHEPPLTPLTPDPEPLLVVDILEHVRTMPSPCGIADVVRLRITTPRLEEPVVLAATGMGGLPHVFEQASPLLTPQARSTERTLYVAPDCLVVRLIDVAGNVRHLPAWCPPDAPTAMGATATGPAGPSGAEASGAPGACAAMPGRPAPASGWMGALIPILAAAFRRRPRKR